MATITFRYEPAYEQEETSVQLIEPNVSYSFEVKNGISDGLQLDDIVYHFESWLRSLGYSL